MEKEKSYVCCKCKEPLVLQKVRFSYLGKEFSHEMLKCPKCGQICISEDMAMGRMSEVEKMLEGK